MENNQEKTERQNEVVRLLGMRKSIMELANDYNHALDNFNKRFPTNNPFMNNTEGIIIVSKPLEQCL